ncbi:MAG TPA: DUF3999 family protein [Vicinamibacterales bacterium]|jgi:hypothetical protein
MRFCSLTWPIALAVACGAAVQGAEETTFRYQAPIVVSQPGAFVLVPLSVEVYAHSQQTGLNDLRVIDAHGERVPFALLDPRGSQVEITDQTREATIYPLPPRPAADGTWAAPVELTVEGDRINVKRRPGVSTAGTAGQRSGGWLVDLGERRPSDPPPRALRFDWTGPAEFTAAYQFETSDDLRRWHPGGAGQLMALVSAAGTLSQQSVVLPLAAGRFVRLVWVDDATPPAIVRAQVLSPEQRTIALDPPAELVFSPGAKPTGKPAAADTDTHALFFDLGGALPIGQVELRWTGGTHVAPVRIEGRTQVGNSWSSLLAGVFYRLDRDGVVSTSGPVTVGALARYVRVSPDPRAGVLDPMRTRLVVRAHLASLVFAAQGQAPYTLLAGSATAPAGPLPVGTLVPALDDERARFGRAALGTWIEVAAAARQAGAERRQAIFRLVLLWSVLVGGVTGLAFMVWRLARGTTPGTRG